MTKESPAIRFTCDQATLKAALSFVTKALPSRVTSMPVLRTVLLHSPTEGVLGLRCSDQEMQASAVCGLDASNVQGDISAVPAKMLLSGVSACHTGEILLSVDNQRLTLTQDAFALTISCEKPEDFPAPWVSPAEPSIILSAPEFANMLSKTLPFAAVDESRPALTGVYVGDYEGELVAVTTDMHRLSVLHIKATSIEEHCRNGCIIPARALNAFKGSVSGEVHISLSDRAARFCCPGDPMEQTLDTRLIEGPYPVYQRVLPAGEGNVLIANREALLSALRRVAMIIPASTAQPRVVLDVNTEEEPFVMQLTAGKVGDEDAHDEVEVQLPNKDAFGGFVHVTYDCNYLIDILSCLSEKEVKIGLHGNLAPSLFHEGEFKHIIMPMQDPA